MAESGVPYNRIWISPAVFTLTPFPKWSAHSIFLPFFPHFVSRIYHKTGKMVSKTSKAKKLKKRSVYFWVCITGKVVPECWGASLAKSSNSKPRAQTYPSNYLHDFISLLNCLIHVCSGFFCLKWNILGTRYF